MRGRSAQSNKHVIIHSKIKLTPSISLNVFVSLNLHAVNHSRVLTTSIDLLLLSPDFCIGVFWFAGDVYLIDYLSAERRYTFMIRARSEMGLGEPLPLVTVTPGKYPKSQC
jgi:hypothetical protein